MPTRWTGTVEERVARLEKSGRRCDGNSRFCTRAAVVKYMVVPADANGDPVQDAQPEERKACSFHRKQFDGNGQWAVLSRTGLGYKPGTRVQGVPRDRYDPERGPVSDGDDGKSSD